ncbi:MAG: leucine-rich repeat domain-containing protein [Clostridia bacterium]|nr:leucine-rich repeat domain-containing protein [Clostridia bacterium]
MKKIRMYEALLLLLCLVGVLLLNGCDRPAQDEPGDGDHTHLPWKLNAVLPGCTTTGLTEGSVCSICDEILVAQEEIPALGHDAVDDPIIELGCVVDGKSAGSHCSRCDKKFELQRITERSTGHRYENGICTVCGEAIEYSQGLKLLPRKNGKYAVSGIGTFEGRHLVIPETAPDGGPITEILGEAFKNCQTLRSVHIPDSVVSIGTDAFSFSSIVHVRLPSTLSEVPGRVFSQCRSLKSVDIPDGVESIGYSAFSGCSKLENIAIPKSVKSISEGAFAGCHALTSVTIPSNVQSIGKDAFSSCQSLVKVVLCDGITDISGTAFAHNHALTYVRYPRTLQDFCGFIDCPQMSEIEIPEDHTSLYFKDGYVLGKTNKTLYHMPIGGTIPDDGSVTRLYAGSMKYHPITEIVLPDSIRNIDTAFAGNTTLTRIVLPEGMLSIPDEAFERCLALQEVVFPSSLEYIGIASFRWCQSLTNVVLPPNTKRILSWAFQGCNALTEITIPGKVITWGGFEDCTALERVMIEEGVTAIGSMAFRGCTALKEVAIPSTLQAIEASAFKGCSSLVAITLPQGLMRIEGSAFSDCTSLTEVNIPFLDSRAKGAFSGCTALERATVGEGVTQVAEGLFNGCTALRYVYIPSTAKWIGNAKFLNADSLEKIEYGGTAEQWEKVRVDAGNTVIHQAERICRQ